jgi:hypothetical protein
MLWETWASACQLLPTSEAGGAVVTPWLGSAGQQRLDTDGHVTVLVLANGSMRRDAPDIA